MNIHLKPHKKQHLNIFNNVRSSMNLYETSFFPNKNSSCLSQCSFPNPTSHHSNSIPMFIPHVKKNPASRFPGASKISLGNSVAFPWLRRTLRSSHSCTLPGAQWSRRSPGRFLYPPVGAGGV